METSFRCPRVWAVLAFLLPLFAALHAPLTAEDSPENQRVARWRSSADKGDAEAMFWLGTAYEKGDGISKNDTSAVYWWRKAAEQGDARAMFCLGSAYLNGRGVTRDQTLAVDWWRQAAEKGQVNAMFNVARAYSAGKGVPKDDVRAVEWWRKAAEHGHDNAMYRLGAALLEGRGVPRNEAAGMEWLSKAARLGNHYAIDRLAILKTAPARREALAPAPTVAPAVAAAPVSESTTPTEPTPPPPPSPPIAVAVGPAPVAAPPPEVKPAEVAAPAARTVQVETPVSHPAMPQSTAVVVTQTPAAAPSLPPAPAPRVETPAIQSVVVSKPATPVAVGPVNPPVTPSLESRRPTTTNEPRADDAKPVVIAPSAPTTPIAKPPAPAVVSAPAVQPSRREPVAEAPATSAPAVIAPPVAPAAAALRPSDTQGQTGHPFVVTRLDLMLMPIPSGSFAMGSATGGAEGERPVTQVTISRPFWLGRTEVTRGQWKRLMGRDPSEWQSEGGDDRPVEAVSWLEAVDFCKRLTEEMRMELPVGYAFSLPTEAEWEYACRAGTTGDYAGDLSALAWYGAKNPGPEAKGPKPVGQRQPNAWGLHDMHGNVAEWCLDITELTGGALTDPLFYSITRVVLKAQRDTGRKAKTSEAHCAAVRGGAWDSSAAACRSAARESETDYGATSGTVGFRIALAPIRDPLTAKKVVHTFTQE